MKISIEYCMQWNYQPQATSLAAAIKDAKDIDVELIAGKGGIFDVQVDDEMIYSKFDTDRFPTHEEIIDKLT